jgi:hypothetical protein
VSSSTSLSNTLSLIEGVIIFIKNLNNSKTQKMKKILKKIRDAIICIIVTPAAAIHIAYQVWYFREYLNSLAAKPSEKRGEEGDK